MIFITFTYVNYIDASTYVIYVNKCHITYNTIDSIYYIKLSSTTNKFNNHLIYN